MAEDIFLFDKLIDDSSIVIRASEIYNRCVREYFYGKKEQIVISPNARPGFFRELPALFRKFFN